METKHTPGAMRAAKLIDFSAHTQLQESEQYRVDEYATIIDKETAAPELLAALESILSGSDMFEDDDESVWCRYCSKQYSGVCGEEIVPIPKDRHCNAPECPAVLGRAAIAKARGVS